MSAPEPDPTAVNRAHWDALAAVHGNGTDRYYDIEALIRGESSLSDVENAAISESIGSVRDRDVLHVQCHIGFDSISLARTGARVTGADLSPASLAKAADIAARCGVHVDFLEADAMDLPATLHDRFDLAYATFGVLGWIGDIDAWMRSVAACLRPGGKLALVELHPLFGMIKSLEPFELWSGYGFAGPVVDSDPGSYADPSEPVAAPTKVLYSHSLGEILTAAARAGLAIEALHEHTDVAFDPLGWLMRRGPDGRWRYGANGYALPALFTLIAARM